jgi:curved DNA-binding protein CbpA
MSCVRAFSTQVYGCSCSYRKLALRWHPKNFSPAEQFEAEAKFREISEAFEVLSNSWYLGIILLSS